MESLQQAIKKYSPPEDTQGEEVFVVDNADRKYLKEKLFTIQIACGTYDKKNAKTALSDLKQKSWPRLIRDQLSTIAEYLLHSEFDKAAALAKETVSN